MNILSVLSDLFPSEYLYRLFPFVLLYPEIHYVFRCFPFSRYFIKQPEILFDVPSRIDPGQKLPALLLIKDADRFPVILESVRLRIGEENFLELDVTLKQNIAARLWYRVFSLDVPESLRGQTVLVHTELHLICRKKKLTIRQDNLPGMKRKPFRVHLARERLPLPDSWIAGDMHIHSDYTSDQVEFGAPIPATVELAKVMGLSFAAITDHSYDLDDEEMNFLKNDPGLPKWKKFQEEVGNLNAAEEPFILIPGEEVTCRNSKERNVHCLVLNEPRYIPGSGDGAEKWLNTRSEHSVRELPDIVSDDALVIAAHPMAPVPFLQHLLINRGNWSARDCETLFLHGLQILNGNRDAAFYKGLKEWVKLLLNGKRVFIFGGNDAHGNFSRFRQVRMPMISLIEKEGFQIFGEAKTVLRVSDGRITLQAVLDSIRQGRAIITDGPFISLTLTNEKKDQAELGGTISGHNFSVHIETASTAEFGALSDVRIIYGKINNEEKIIGGFHPGQYQFRREIKLSAEAPGYIRAELETADGHFGYTNPVWILPDSKP